MIITRNCLSLTILASLFFIAGIFWGRKIKTESFTLLGGYQTEKGGHETEESTLDCRDWSSQRYSTVKSPIIGEVMDIHDDADNHDRRLKNWINRWNAVPAEGWVPKSGPGSTLPASKNFRLGLDKIVTFLKKNLKKDMISILDASCGDMTWMPSFLRGRKDIEYTGYDLLPVNIENARKRFANETWKFKAVDSVKERIRIDFDLIISRHVAIHLGLMDDIQMFHNFFQSGSRYLLTTTYPNLPKNKEFLAATGAREVNLAIPPFLFPTPICLAPDAPVAPTQFFGFWSFKDLEGFDQRNQRHIREFEE